MDCVLLCMCVCNHESVCLLAVGGPGVTLPLETGFASCGFEFLGFSQTSELHTR